MTELGVFFVFLWEVLFFFCLVSGWEEGGLFALLLWFWDWDWEDFFLYMGFFFFFQSGLFFFFFSFKLFPYSLFAQHERRCNEHSE